MNYYTSTIPSPLAEKLKEKGMPIIFDVWTEEDGINRMVDIFHGIYKERKHHPLPSYAEVFDWLMSEKGVYISGFRWFDTWRWAYTTEWRFRIELEDISQEEVNGYIVNGNTWHEAAEAAIEKALTLI